jgi:CHASE1-domain containing sensor protein
VQNNSAPTIYLTNPLLLALVLAGLYIATAKLGFMMAVPPGNVTVIWPPSGIALAATVLFGWRAALGIWIGSCAVNFWTIDSPLTAQISTTIALGSTLQAMIGGYFLHKLCFNRTAKKFSLAIQVFSFFSLSALCCLIAASFGISSLYAAKLITANQVMDLWQTWWLGDYVGILIISPLLIKLAHQPLKTTAIPWLLPICSMLFGLALINFFLSWQAQSENLQEELNHKTSIMQLQLQRELRTSLQNLENLATVISIDANLDRQKFKTLAQQFLTTTPAISALTWSPVIAQEKLAEHIASAQKQGFDQYALFEKTALGEKIPAKTDRYSYYPILFIEPEADNKQFIGFDNGADASRLSSIQVARDSKKITATGIINPLQDTTHNEFILLFNPVYSHEEYEKSHIEAEHHDLNAHRQHLRGFVVALIKLNKLIPLSQEMAKLQQMDATLWDASIADKPTLLTSTINNSHPDDRLLNSTTIDIANRRWKLDIYLPKNHLEHSNTSSIWVSFIINIIILLIIIGYAELRNQPKRDSN